MHRHPPANPCKLGQRAGPGGSPFLRWRCARGCGAWRGPQQFRLLCGWCWVLRHGLRARPGSSDPLVLPPALYWRRCSYFDNSNAMQERRECRNAWCGALSAALPALRAASALCCRSELRLQEPPNGSIVLASSLLNFIDMLAGVGNLLREPAGAAAVVKAVVLAAAASERRRLAGTAAEADRASGLRRANATLQVCAYYHPACCLDLLLFQTSLNPRTTDWAGSGIPAGSVSPRRCATAAPLL